MQNKNVEKARTGHRINQGEAGTQYGIDAAFKYDNGKGDSSEMRKAPGYNGQVPGVNTPEIRFPTAEDKEDVSIPAFNPPVPNRAWTEMRKNLKIEGLTESEKRDLYGNKPGEL